LAALCAAFARRAERKDRRFAGAVEGVRGRLCENLWSAAVLVCAEPIWGPMRDRALRWLHDMAIIARRMILLRAMQMNPPANTPPFIYTSERVLHCLRPREGSEAQLLAGSKDPAHWRVRFSPGAPFDSSWLKSGGPQQYERARKAKWALYYADDPRPLAEKFEVLLRVIEDPDYYAAKFAARLHRWKGRAQRLEKFVRAMSMKNAMQVFNEAQLEESAFEPAAGSSEMAQNMSPVFLRIEDS
jgi:hypothetical protein